MKEDALKKIEKQLDKYRKSMSKKKSQEVYQSAMTIMFTEACASYTCELLKLDMEKLSEFVMNKHTTLGACVKNVIRVAKRVGNLGDLTKEHFQEAIYEYYNLNHDEIARQKEIKRLEAKAQADKRKKRN